MQKLILLTTCIAFVACTSAIYDENWSRVLSRFAAASYCPATDIMAWNCTSCSEIISKTHPIGFYEDPLTHSMFYVASNTFYNTTFVVFRGSESKNVQAWVNTLAQPRKGIPFLNANYMVDSEFLFAYAQLTSSLTNVLLRAVEQFPYFSLAVTGHGLGGAFATLFAAEHVFSRSHVPIHSVITYGSPRVGNANFTEFYNSYIGLITYREVHFRDAVSLLPVSFFDGSPFQHVSREVWYGPNYSNYKICDDSLYEDPTCSVKIGNLATWLDHQSYHNIPISDHCCYNSKCQDGLWGNCCHDSCPNPTGVGHCLQYGCNNTNGECLTGATLCQSGWWGSEYCDLKCPNPTGHGHCYYYACDVNTGYCLHDGTQYCEAGWWGDKYCDKQCPNPSGHGHCKLYTCDVYTGQCSGVGNEKCEAGWWGMQYCDKHCPNSDGSGHCKSYSCNVDNGTCLPGGCEDGWWGIEFCNKQCPYTCSRCNQSTGMCY